MPHPSVFSWQEGMFQKQSPCAFLYLQCLEEPRLGQIEGRLLSFNHLEVAGTAIWIPTVAAIWAIAFGSEFLTFTSTRGVYDASNRPASSSVSLIESAAIASSIWLVLSAPTIGAATTTLPAAAP